VPLVARPVKWIASSGVRSLLASDVSHVDCTDAVCTSYCTIPFTFDSIGHRWIGAPMRGRRRAQLSASFCLALAPGRPPGRVIRALCVRAMVGQRQRRSRLCCGAPFLCVMVTRACRTPGLPAHSAPPHAPVCGGDWARAPGVVAPARACTEVTPRVGFFFFGRSRCGRWRRRSGVFVGREDRCREVACRSSTASACFCAASFITTSGRRPTYGRTAPMGGRRSRGYIAGALPWAMVQGARV